MNKPPKQGRGIGSMEKSKRPTPNPGTQKISKKASGPMHALMTTKAMGGWITHKIYPPRRKLVYAVFICFNLGPFWAVLSPQDLGRKMAQNQEEKHEMYPLAGQRED